MKFLKFLRALCGQQHGLQLGRHSQLQPPASLRLNSTTAIKEHLYLLLNRRGLQLGSTVEHQLQPALRGRTGTEWRIQLRKLILWRGMLPYAYLEALELTAAKDEPLEFTTAKGRARKATVSDPSSALSVNSLS